MHLWCKRDGESMICAENPRKDEKASKAGRERAGKQQPHTHADGAGTIQSLDTRGEEELQTQRTPRGTGICGE